MIPILIICYNNWKYLQNTLNQLINFNDIIIMDNKSTDQVTIDFLKNVNVKVIYNESNNGPWVTPDNNSHIWNTLPDRFILTDPDLQFNKNLPDNFIETLVEISDLHNAYKVGFALDISDFDKMYQLPNYHFGQSIYQWEYSQHWSNRLIHPEYEIYLAPIDTTFCLISKNKNPCNGVRIAGNFIAKHIPWYTSNPIYNICSNYISNQISTKISNMSSIIVNDIISKYSKITKNDQLFFIPKTDPNINFWGSVYSGWESETFEIFDKFLSKDKIFIDIGAWIGTTTMYAARKSKEVYSVEADSISMSFLKDNCNNNCTNNIHFVHKAVYSKSGEMITFGKNLFLNNSTLNDSTSQIGGIDGYSIESISFLDLVADIDPMEISLIKVDIEGGEENILDDLFKFYNKFGVPMYISFHVDWWKNKDLTRFKDLEKWIPQIKQNPFTSILFNKSPFIFMYGIDNYSVDVTENVYKRCFKDGTIVIPYDDVVRAELLGDPIFGTLKWFYIQHSDSTIEKYSDSVEIKIKDGSITTEVIIKPVIVAIAKLESDYIVEWVNYHLALGFERIYLYDNEDIPVYQNLGEKVTIFHMPGNTYPKPVQYHSLEHFNFNIIQNKNITHVIHIDIDEFIALKKHSCIKDFIKEYFTDDVAGIGINWRHFGDSGQTEHSYEPVTKRFTMCEYKGNKTIKTLFDKTRFNGWRICHCISPKDPYIVKNTNGLIIPESYCIPDYSVIQINHYKCKTLIEFTNARTRGRCDIHNTYIKTENDDFDRFNYNEIQDLTAYYFYNKNPKLHFENVNAFLSFNGIGPIEGNSNQLPEQIHDLVILSKGATNILEIGFNAGHSAEIFLKNNPMCKVVSFDLGEHSYVYKVKEYIDYMYPNRHTLIFGDSTKTIPEYPNEIFDLIFIDGGHSLEIAQQDLKNCCRLGHQLTILAMDDIVYRSHAPWTIGPTQAWVGAKRESRILEVKSKEYSPGRGMCWGNYM